MGHLATQLPLCGPSHLQVLYLPSPGKNRIFTIQSLLASKKAPSLLNRILGDLGGELAGGEEDPGSSVWFRRRDNWASTFLERDQKVDAGAVGGVLERGVGEAGTQ